MFKAAGVGVPLHKGVAPNRTKVTIRKLDFRYGANQALEDVSRDLPEKQVTGSTLLRVPNRLYSLYPIDNLKRHVIVALVTHNMQQAARCADQVVFFYLGELVEIGSTTALFTAPRQKKTQNYVAGKFG
jgi:ABC-type phosphate transport system ATPase subunit